MSQFFALGGQLEFPTDAGVSTSASVLPMNILAGLISFRIDWFDLLAVQGTLKSLLCPIVEKKELFGAQPSLWSNSHIRI